jgi:hypothetical protein
MMTLVGMDLLSAVDVNSSEFREAYLSEERFVLHGKITRESETRDGDSVEWVYRIESTDSDLYWPTSVSSEFDLGEVGDEVYFKATRNGGVGIPECYYITAESGPISPIVPWAGLVIIILGLSSMVLLERSKKSGAKMAPS